PFTGILITEAARSEGGWLLNKDGYRYLQDYNLGKPEPKPVLRSMELGPRDRLSQAFVKEVEKGRTLKGPYGDFLHLDLRHLGARAGRAAAEFASRQGEPASAVLAQAHDEKRRLERDFLRKDGGTERLATLREEMQRTMEQGAGIYRSGPALAGSAEKLRQLQ